MQSMEEKPQLAAEGKDAASDEEIARRLQQQLNGEAAAAARRRTRKQPTFYSPQVGHCFIAFANSPPHPIQGVDNAFPNHPTHAIRYRSIVHSGKLCDCGSEYRTGALRSARWGVIIGVKHLMSP